MIKVIKHTRSFKKDVKRYKHKKEQLKKLAEVLRVIVSGKELERKFKDHALKGNYVDRRECHVESDLLLIYC